MAYKRILTIQDISCVGQCSLTVALPILSACGHETAILPSAVLSTHTGGFTGFTFRDLSDDMPAINAHWQKEGLKFEAIYTGYLGSVSQIDYVREIMDTSLTEGGLRIVDPAMADNGKLYSLFDKVNNRDLLMTNCVYQPGNLAIRNAWHSGGIEFNFGNIGHHYFTCDNLFVALLKDEQGNFLLIAIKLVGRFQNHRKCRKVWMVHNSPERFQSQTAAANAGMPVFMTGKRILRIVQMNCL